MTHLPGLFMCSCFHAENIREGLCEWDSHRPGYEDSQDLLDALNYQTPETNSKST